MKRYLLNLLIAIDQGTGNYLAYPAYPVRLSNAQLQSLTA